ncbi:hypothetical protein ABLT88_06045 [Acinetobacter radioresistens]|jgi:hypothetical protein|uniref:hypothetical protein n=1 Tax=Acinetobacter radioresistens TaxID=40216 RepID=UPI000277C254|nr:hypothetical protein [Acinetobacter radioresistens]EJO35003.1 hypothetical protein ACINWCA157_0078 [Acinetobacter radioresistens WC-A-157]
MKKTGLGILFVSILSSSTLYAMTELDDNALSQVEGQALLNLVVTNGNNGSDSLGQSYNQDNIKFYKLGLDAQIELNTNIKKLQLGCGGDNGTGNCDIDIDHLSLSGISDTSNGRVNSSALIKNPFIEFAIKNPLNSANREVQGFRVSAEAIEGLLTFGTENSGTKNGINAFSGYMVTKETTGTVKTGAVTSGLTQSALNKVITGQAKSSSGAIRVPFESNDYDIKLSAATGSLLLPSQVISGKRITTAELKGTANVSGINLSGTIDATATLIGFIPIGISGDLSGVINNLGVNVSVSENLGYFHKVNLNGTAASLSLQTQNLVWPGAKSTASKGWWLELSNPIDIGDVSPKNDVIITKDVVAATLDQVSAYLSKNENAVDCGFLTTSCLLAGKINTGTVNLTGKYVPMALNNLVLTNQGFASNCYGGLKFC